MKKKVWEKRSTSAVLVQAALYGTIMAANVAYAQSDSDGEGARTLQEIVVTAQRRSESLRDVPIAMTAVTPELAEQFGLKSIKDIGLVAPSVDVAASPGFLKLYMRGLGQAFVTPGLESPVAMYLDGGYLQRMSGVNSLFDLVDIDRVEVLRGPQGTLYGRNATGGAMLLHTANPTEDFEGRVAAEYGRFNRHKVEGMVNIPLTDTLSARFAAQTVKSDGYIKNIATGDDMYGDDNYTVRGKLRWQPDDIVDVVLGVEYQESKPSKSVNQNSYGAPICYVCQTSGDGVVPGFYKTNENARPDWDISLFRSNLNATFSLGDYELISRTSYLDDDAVQGTDSDFTPVDVFNYEILGMGGHTFSQEFTLSSQYDGPFNFLTGVNYLKDNGNIAFALTGASFAFFPVFPVSASEVETESVSAFAEVVYDITENITATIGGRYTKDERTLDTDNNVSFQAFGLPASFSLDDDFNAFTPRFVLSWSNDSTNIYYSYTEGFKAGGFSTPATAPINAVDPEEIEGHEIGIKHKAFDDRLTSSLAVFYYENQDYQSQVIDINGAGNVVQNAGGIDGQGIELEIQALPADGLSLGVTLSYLDVEYSSYPNASAVCVDLSGTGNPNAPGAVMVPCALDLGGERVPHAPELSGSIYASYDFSIGDWGANLSGLVNSRSSYDFYPAGGGDLNHDKQDSYTVANFSGYVRPPGTALQLGFYLDNAFGEEYIIDAATYATYGAAYVAAAPRTYGLRVSYDF